MTAAVLQSKKVYHMSLSCCRHVHALHQWAGCLAHFECSCPLLLRLMSPPSCSPPMPGVDLHCVGRHLPAGPHAEQPSAGRAGGEGGPGGQAAGCQSQQGACLLPILPIAYFSRELRLTAQRSRRGRSAWHSRVGRQHNNEHHLSHACTVVKHIFWPVVPSLQP